MPGHLAMMHGLSEDHAHPTLRWDDSGVIWWLLMS